MKEILIYELFTQTTVHEMLKYFGKNKGIEIDW